MSTPELTVLMSVHNGARWVGAAVESVLGQSIADFEFLIIDDASTDNTVREIEAFNDSRIRLLKLRENIGLTRALNTGLSEARGRFIARQDADDISLPGRLAAQLAFLKSHENVAVVGCQGWICHATGQRNNLRLLATTTEAIRWAGLFFNPFLHTAVMFRAHQIRDELGGYDESFPVCQDYDLWMRAASRFDVANLEEPLVEVREHGSSVSAIRKSSAADAVRRVVEAQLQRLFPGRQFPAWVIDATCSFRQGPAPADPAGFLRVFALLADAYLADLPTAAHSREFQRARAVLERDCGYRALAVDRRVAVTFLWMALERWPALATSIPWIRTLALLVLGEHARSLYLRFSGASSGG